MITLNLLQMRCLQTGTEFSVITNEYRNAYMQILGKICVWMALILGFAHLIVFASLATGFAFTPHNASKAYIYIILFTQVPALMACAVFAFWLATAIAFEKRKQLAIKLLGASVGIYLLSWLILIVSAETGLIK